MTEHEELKPCPFCGGSAAIAYEGEVVTEDGSTNGYTVRCWKCFAKSSPRTDEISAIYWWNTRAESSQLTHQPDACRAALQELVDLKYLKTHFGECQEYLKRKSMAWARAMQVLERAPMRESIAPPSTDHAVEGGDKPDKCVMALQAFVDYSARHKMDERPFWRFLIQDAKSAIKEVLSVSKFDAKSQFLALLDSPEVREEVYKAYFELEYPKHECVFCDGQGRESDDTPCSNPNEASQCKECGGRGWYQKKPTAIDRLNAAINAIKKRVGV